MWPWLIRLIGGWLPIGTKPASEWLGKILWAVGIFLVCTFVWNKLTAATTTIKPHQEVEGQLNNVYHQESLRPMVGCASLRVIEYYKDKKPQEVKK